MKQLSTLIAACTLSLAANAQISLTGANPTYTQDFNTLDTAAFNSSNLPAGWAIQETGTGASANEQYRSGRGTDNAGDTYSYGATQSTDRALGAQSSGTVQSRFGAAFLNNTGANISSISMTVRMEQWRAGDTSSRLDSLLFYYSSTATALDSTETAWTEVPALLLLSAQPSAPTQSGIALDGNTVSTTKTGTVQLSTPVAQGSQLRIKWLDKNIGGADDGLAIDDLSITFVTTVGINDVSAGRLPVSILGRATSGRIVVGFTAAKREAFTIALFDLNGREVTRQIVDATAGANQATLMPASIAAGPYIVRVSNGISFGTVKVVVE